MENCVRKAITNIRGGLSGILVYLVITVIIFLAAFMASLGNDTPTARFIVESAAVWFLVANPLWAIPLAYFVGGYLFCRRDEACEREDSGAGKVP